MPSDLPLDPNIVASLRALGDEEFVQEIVELFASDASSRLVDMRQRVAIGDWQAVTRQAHSLRGAAGNVGAREVASQAGVLERDAEAGPVAGAEDILVRLTAAVDEALAALRTPTPPDSPGPSQA